MEGFWGYKLVKCSVVIGRVRPPADGDLAFEVAFASLSQDYRGGSNSRKQWIDITIKGRYLKKKSWAFHEWAVLKIATNLR